MTIAVCPYSADWARQFAEIADGLRRALVGIPSVAIEHVGSTSVPGLAAKPVIDVDVVVDVHELTSAVAALEAVGYRHRGDLGIEGREAFRAPDDNPRRNVYVCAVGNLHLRNHLAVRQVLRQRDDLRDEYAAVKMALAAEPQMDIDAYLAGKSRVLQKILAESDLTAEERARIWKLNDPAI